MHRAAAVLSFIVIWPAISRAADPKPADESAKQEVVFSVQPKAAPVPALKYQLLPTLEEMNPGNPIQGYLKCFMEESPWFNDPKTVDVRQRWTEMPLARLPVQQILREYRGSPGTEIDYAARLDTPDWQCLIGLKMKGGTYLLPDVTALRQLAYTIDVRFRAQVAAGHFDDAIASAKTMFAMSRHYNAHPCLVADFCGASVLNMALGVLEEMVQQRGCPNLYWALSSLPSPMIEIDRGLQGEQQIYRSPPFASLANGEPTSDAELQKVIDQLDESLQYFESGPNARQPKKGYVRRTLLVKSIDKQKVLAAQQCLLAAGYDATKLARFSSLQMILADEYLALIETFDDERKAMLLPYWQTRAVLATDHVREPGEADRGSSLHPFVAPLDGARRLVAELDQRVAMLRCVEALRIYAADHAGHLPKRLEDVPVPVPLDPVSGQAFSYRLEGEMATIRPTTTVEHVGDYVHKQNPIYKIVIDTK